MDNNEEPLPGYREGYEEGFRMGQIEARMVIVQQLHHFIHLVLQVDVDPDVEPGRN